MRLWQTEHSMISVSRTTVLNIVMDALFLVTALLAEHGLRFLSAPVNALLLFAMYYVFLYFYRYVYIHQIGAGARPLLQQMNVTLPVYIDYPVKGIFTMAAACFPALILTLCLHIAQPLLQFNSGENPFLPAMVGMFLVFTLIINAIIFLANGMPHEVSITEWSLIDSIQFGYRTIPLFPRPNAAAETFIGKYFIPFIAVLTMVLLSNVRSIWSAMDDPGEPWQLLIMTLGAFVPFRYLILRIAGVSYVSLISLVCTVVLITLVFLW